MNQKYILVTGASRGIGRSIALKLAREGYHVFLNCRTSLNELEEVQNKILSMPGGSCTITTGDVGDPDGAPAQQHNDHGDLCLTCTPEDACTAVAQSQKAPEQRFNMRLLHPIGNDVRIPVERCHQPGRRGEYDHAHNLRNADGA